MADVLDIGDATLEVRIAPAHRRIDLQAYTHILTELRKALEEVDRIAIPERTARVQWAIEDVSMKGEARMLLAPKILPARRALSTLSVSPDGLVKGVRSLATEARIPAYFSDGTVGRVEQIGKHVRSGDIHHVAVSSAHSRGDEAVVDVNTTENASKAIQPVKKAFSSIVGTLDVLEHRRGRSPRAQIRVSGTRHAVRIVAHSDQAAALRDAWGMRVVAEGLLKRNILGQPVSLELTSLEVAGEASAGVDPWLLLGADPGFTGGLSTADYLERVRRG